MRRFIAAAALLLGVSNAALGQLPAEAIGGVEALPQPLKAHWAWASDILFGRTVLVDLESGRFLGQMDTGYGPFHPVFSRSRPEIYLIETYYSRGSRGERTDVLTIYDAPTLKPIAEVVLPPKRALANLSSGVATLSDDERFLAVFNLTPATSLSIVDLELRRFVGEIATPGCSLVFSAGVRRFIMLCGNGGLLTVSLDEEGRAASVKRSPPFFDPEADPVTEKAVRYRDEWLFVSFEGYLHAVDVSGDMPQPREKWSLLDKDDRGDSWKIGGRQHLAVHSRSGRLFSLVHQGGEFSYKHPGSEVWIYDLDKRERVQRLELVNPGFTYMGVDISIGEDWTWPLNRLAAWALDRVPFPGVDALTVTGDREPLLVTGVEFSGSLGVYDARSLEFLRRVNTGNITVGGLQAPPWGDSP